MIAPVRPPLAESLGFDDVRADQSAIIRSVIALGVGATAETAKNTHRMRTSSSGTGQYSELEVVAGER